MIRFYGIPLLLLEVVTVRVSTTHTKCTHVYCTVKDLNTHHMLYNGHSVPLNLCMSFAKCAIKWIVVNIILFRIPFLCPTKWQRHLHAVGSN